MSTLGNIIRKVADFATRKSYLGFTRYGLPKNSWNWGVIDFLNANDISLYTNKAIEKRAEKVGQIKFILKRGDTVVENDPRLKVLYQPNKFFTGAEFWELYQKYKDLTGSAYIYMETQRDLFAPKQVTGLHLLRPDLVKKIYNKETGVIEKFVFREGTAEEQSYSPEQIIYSFRPDPKNQLEGMSLLKAGIRSIDTEVQLSEYHSKILRNGGKVEGVFRFKTPKLNRTQLDEMKADYKRDYSEAKNAGLPLFLGGDAEYSNLGLNPQELSYLEAKNVTLNDILIMTGVPKSLLASMDEIKFDNADAGRQIFLRETIKPLYQNLCTKLDLILFPEDDLDLSFEDPVPEDLTAKLKKLETANTVYALTTNEKREILGFDPVDNGDEILVPFSVTPLADAIAPAPAADPNQPPANKSFDTASVPHPLRDPFIRRKYHQLYIKKSDRRERQFLQAIKRYFEEQRKRLQEKLQPAHTRVFRRKNLIDETFNKTLEIKIARDTFLPVLETVLKESGDDALALIGSDKDFNITSTISSWLANKAEVFAESINQTTFEKLQSEFTESLSAGETRDQLINRIQTTYGDIEEGRAATIARTEIGGASQKGTFEGYKQANMPIKIWVAVLDDRTRESHAELDGEEKPIDHPFSNGLMFPGDPSGEAEEVINCRCTI